MIHSMEIDGVERFFGNLASDGITRMYAWKHFGDSSNVPILPRDQWKPVNLSGWLPPIYDQNGQGACNAFSSTTVLETCRAIEGLTYVRLSPGYLYGCINGQRDQGSMLEDALKQLENVGTCPASVVAELAWQRSKWPADAAKAANPYRIIESFKCPSGRDLIPSMVSALELGFTLNAGSLWYNNYSPDSNNRIPKKKKGNAGGHAYCVFGSTVESDGVWFDMRNSWGKWGVNGCAKIHETAFDDTIGGVWAVRAVTLTGANPMPNPT